MNDELDLEMKKKEKNSADSASMTTDVDVSIPTGSPSAKKSKKNDSIQYGTTTRYKSGQAAYEKFSDKLNSSRKINQDEGAPNYYIGIGASAGGLEALQEFFQYMPDSSDAAFIVVQHLSPNFKSVMDELLSKQTNMPVLNVEDGQIVKRNTVYLIPPRKNMVIKNGILLLTEQIRIEHTLNLPIDIFFRSLAEDQKHKAIGAVFSGTGSDGSRGLRAIKEVGGLVVVQDPNTAKFDGMPNNAVNTGVADIVTSPAKIPEAIVKYISHPINTGQQASVRDDIEHNHQILKEIFKLLKAKCSIDFSYYKSSTIARRIERRMGINQLSTTNDYLKLLFENPNELEILGKDILIGVTSFFRDAKVFEQIVSEVLPAIISSKKAGDSIRIWSAGCSTGEEAYSLAILIDEELRKRNLSNPVKIFATDIDSDAITEAATGTYAPEIAEEVSGQHLKNYFVKKESMFIIKSDVRRMVIFAHHNMITDPPFSNIDLALCRNVLIYFQQKIQKRVISAINFSLNNTGYMVLGTSESIGDLTGYFETVHEKLRIYRKNRKVRLPFVEDGSEKKYSNENSFVIPENAYNRPERRIDRNTWVRVVGDRLINEYAPPAIIVNEDFEAVQIYGDINNFVKKIQPGRVNNNVMNIVREEIKVALSTALLKAKRNKETVLYKDIRLKYDLSNPRHIEGKDDFKFDLRIHCVNEGTIAYPAHYFIIVFENVDLNQAVPEAGGEIFSYDAMEVSQQRISDLETELQKNQENLQVIIEELETTNEELQAANEELMAANEELQSTNEELQSVNEELFTVNSEYQEKITELTDLNNDLDNVLFSIDIGIVFLDESFCIRNYTPAIRNYINIMNSDLGRPFYHISNNLKYPELLQDISTVFEKETPMERAVAIENKDNLALVKIRPYQQQSGKSTGVTITVTDIVSTVMGHFDSVPKDKVRSLFDRIGARILGPIENSYRVLLVDDEAIDAMNIEKQLNKIKNAHFEIIVESDIFKAEKKLCSSDFDVCLLDFRLGAETGTELLERIENIKLPIIMVFGEVNPKLKEEAFKLGVYDCLDKSVLTPDLLARTIEYAVQSKKAKESLESM